MTAPRLSSRPPIHDVLLPGTPVHARGLRWEVVDSTPAGEQVHYRLRCVQGALRGREIDLLSPFETVEAAGTTLDPRRAGTLPEWVLYHQAFVLDQALGPAALQAVEPGRLSLAPYQLVPVMRALSMSRPRLLLADGVGLGKTIEAGLIVAELIARRRAHRVLIISPAGPLLQQWHDEMRQRFGLRFEALRDWSALQEKRRRLIVGANPFDHASLCLLSIDFAKQEKVMIDLERAVWDLVIIDEAHHCVKLGSVGDREEDSQRRRLAELLARHADGLLLLTATPHDGYDEHFASLLDLLDPSLLDGRGRIRGDAYKRHVVRRLKHHIKKPGTNEPLFKTRVVLPRPVGFGPETHATFAALQSGLLALVAPRLKQALRQRRYGDVLAFVSLLKRSVSTAKACRVTLEAIAARYEEMLQKGDEQADARKQRLRTLADYRRRTQRYGALSVDEEADQALLEAEDMASHLRDRAEDGFAERLDGLVHHLKLEHKREARRRKTHDETHAGLQDLIAIAEAAELEDPKIAQVVEELRAIRDEEPDANILVYTEYTDSQAAVADALRAAIARGTIRGDVLTIEGDDNERQREQRIERFCTQSGLVMVSTDATAEGLNLHAQCHHLIHVELPYNPNRLEQRNGRIDRYGQERDPIVRYLYLRGTFEERVLLRLIAKYEKQRARLTFVPNTLGLTLSDQSAMTQRLLDGLADEEAHLFREEKKSQLAFDLASSDDDVSTPAYKELLAEVDRAIGGFERASKTHGWLAAAGMNADPAQVTEAESARSIGERLGAPDLVSFVCEAVANEMKAADAVRDEADSVLALRLPPSWAAGLDVPGWNAETRTLRITRDPTVVRTASGESVGFLGRAHPVVRRALDRVRNLPVTSGAQVLDRRVSAIAGKAGERAALLYTFLCTVRSNAGRELERVFAVMVTQDGSPSVLTEPGEWLDNATRAGSVATAGLWERDFASWTAGLEEHARRAAASAFEDVASAFQQSLHGELRTEEDDLQRWLDARAEALCGERQAQLQFDRQLTIAGMSSRDAQPHLGRVDLQPWQTSADPRERLASFAADSTQPPSRRQEAAGVLQLYSKRVAHLDRRKTLSVTPPVTLGLLLCAQGRS